MIINRLEITAAATAKVKTLIYRPADSDRLLQSQTSILHLSVCFSVYPRSVSTPVVMSNSL